MPLLSGLLFKTPFEHLTDIKHTKHYTGQHKDPSERSMFGYSIIKLDEDVTYHVGWRQDDMKAYHAKKGEYLVQCPLQPPSIVKTWAELQTTYHIFRNRSK